MYTIMAWPQEHFRRWDLAIWPRGVARLTHTNMILVAMVSLVALLRSGGAEPQCASPGDIGSEEACSLNGVCSGDSSGVEVACRCDRGWHGPRCSQLDLAPAVRRSPGYYNTSMPTWYGSVVEEHG